nr:HPr family phosphocarrier protein [uncultured Sellimonas sp.]
MTTRNVITADIESRYEAPGVELVRIACQFQSRIMLKSGDMHVNAKSIMGMMAFRPSKGMEIEITAEGDDEEKAALEIEAFLKNE